MMNIVLVIKTYESVGHVDSTHIFITFPCCESSSALPLPRHLYTYFVSKYLNTFFRNSMENAIISLRRHTVQRNIIWTRDLLLIFLSLALCWRTNTLTSISTNSRTDFMTEFYLRRLSYFTKKIQFMAVDCWPMVNLNTEAFSLGILTIFMR